MDPRHGGMVVPCSGGTPSMSKLSLFRLTTARIGASSEPGLSELMLSHGELDAARQLPRADEALYGAWRAGRNWTARSVA